MRRDRLFTGYRPIDLFWREAAWPDHEEEPDLSEKTETLVVDCSYAALSAALVLQRNGVETCVLDTKALC